MHVGYFQIKIRINYIFHDMHAHKSAQLFVSTANPTNEISCRRTTATINSLREKPHQILIWRRDAGPSETNCTQTQRHQLGGFVESKRMCVCFSVTVMITFFKHSRGHTPGRH